MKLDLIGSGCGWVLPNDNANLSAETHWQLAAKTRMGKYLTRLETDFIYKSINPSRLSLIIDVGAEAGRFSMLAECSKATVIAMDIDSYSLKRLKAKSGDVNIVQADARKIPFRDDIFSAAFMIQVLDYIPEAEQALTECNRILNSGSPFILSFGNQSSLKAKLRGIRGKSYMHSYKKVMQLMRKTDFSVAKKLGYSWLPFGRMSNSSLVPISAGAERLLGLRRIPSLSPWVIVCAAKTKE